MKHDNFDLDLFATLFESKFNGWGFVLDFRRRNAFCETGSGGFQRKNAFLTVTSCKKKRNLFIGWIVSLLNFHIGGGSRAGLGRGRGKKCSGPEKRFLHGREGPKGTVLMPLIRYEARSLISSNSDLNESCAQFHIWCISPIQHFITQKLFEGIARFERYCWKWISGRF